jgi:hypothetical protein
MHPPPTGTTKEGRGENRCHLSRTRKRPPLQTALIRWRSLRSRAIATLRASFATFEIGSGLPVSNLAFTAWIISRILSQIGFADFSFLDMFMFKLNVVETVEDGLVGYWKRHFTLCRTRMPISANHRNDPYPITDPLRSRLSKMLVLVGIV